MNAHRIFGLRENPNYYLLNKGFNNLDGSNGYKVKANSPLIITLTPAQNINPISDLVSLKILTNPKEVSFDGVENLLIDLKKSSITNYFGIFDDSGRSEFVRYQFTNSQYPEVLVKSRNVFQANSEAASLYVDKLLNLEEYQPEIRKTIDRFV
jgi:hypothetical protein